MDKLYVVTDAEAPADNSLVTLPNGNTICELSIAEEFIAANQVQYEEPVVLGDGTELFERYQIVEAKIGETDGI
jgi:hypothetical protein